MPCCSAAVKSCSIWPISTLDQTRSGYCFCSASLNGFGSGNGGRTITGSETISPGKPIPSRHGPAAQSMALGSAQGDNCSRYPFMARKPASAPFGLKRIARRGRYGRPHVLALSPLSLPDTGMFLPRWYSVVKVGDFPPLSSMTPHHMYSIGFLHPFFDFFLNTFLMFGKR